MSVRNNRNIDTNRFKNGVIGIEKYNRSRQSTVDKIDQEYVLEIETMVNKIRYPKKYKSEDRLLVISRVKEFVNKYGFRVGRDYIDALNYIIIKIIKESMARAQAQSRKHKRVTLYSKDLPHLV